MAAPLLPKKSLLVAVDTNVLLDLAEDNEHVWGAIETIRRRLKGAQIVVLPTVIQELANLVEHGDTPHERELAGKAARRLVKSWKFAPINFIPVGHGITERIANGLREHGLLPPEEVNDSFIVAESALASCAILLSSDGHIREIPADKLNLLLAAAHVATVVISTPREIAKKFGW
jgi:predicted nucleic acid-binding protein